MIENKRFEIDEDGNITDTKTDRTLYVENRYTECDYYVNLLNELFDENEQLKKVIDENGKLIQSTYEELTKLGHIKKNLERIKAQWDWMMEAIQKKGDLLSEINNGRKRKRKVKSDNKVDYVGLSKDDIVKK